MTTRVYDFPGHGVGAFVAGDGKVEWLGLFLTGLDGEDLNLQVKPSGAGGFDVFCKKALPVEHGQKWPNDKQGLVPIGKGAVAEADNQLYIDLSISRLGAGGAQVTTSPPPPANVIIKLTGVRIS